MSVEARLSILAWLILALAADSFAGCRKDSSAKAGPVNEAAIKQSLEGLKPRLSDLNATFAALHKQVDPLPIDLPGFSEVRAKFYATDEGLGIMGPKITWLSGRLDAARAAKNREELQRVSKDIEKTYDEMRVIDNIALELVHQLLPFQRLAAELEAKESSRPAAVPTPPVQRPVAK